MNILFLHEFFPGHYPHLAPALAADPRNRVVFLTREPAGSLPGVTKRLYAPHRPPDRRIHPYLQPMEAAVLSGQAAFRACRDLKDEGFEPDLVWFHAGFGPALYVREVFPRSRLLGTFEWYYRAQGGDAAFLELAPLAPDAACAIRTRNAAILLDLAEADRGLCATAFQRSQFPMSLRRKLTVLHEGIDTDFFRPAPGTRLILPGLDLSQAAELVTYATRGMEPYRGFPQFMRAIAQVMRRRPKLQVVVAGDDSVWYSRRLPDGRTYRAQMLAELPDLDLNRLHFVGTLALPDYRRLLQASSAHIYLTVPFVLSWSLLESMACGCLVVGSDTAPVREVMTDGVQGLLTDFFDEDGLALRIEEALEQPAAMAPLRAAARARVLERYALTRLLPLQRRLVRGLATPKPRSVSGALALASP